MNESVEFESRTNAFFQPFGQETVMTVASPKSPAVQVAVYWVKARMVVELPSLPAPYMWKPQVRWEILQSMRWIQCYATEAYLSPTANHRLHNFVKHVTSDWDGKTVWVLLRRILPYPAARTVFSRLIRDDFSGTFASLNKKHRRLLSSRPLTFEVPLYFTPTLHTNNAQTRREYRFVFDYAPIESLVEAASPFIAFPSSDRFLYTRLYLTWRGPRKSLKQKQVSLLAPWSFPDTIWLSYQIARGLRPATLDQRLDNHGFVFIEVVPTLRSVDRCDQWSANMTAHDDSETQVPIYTFPLRGWYFVSTARVCIRWPQPVDDRIVRVWLPQ